MKGTDDMSMKILIATDGSASAMHAVAEASRLLPLAAAEVTVVAVTDPSLRFGGNEDAANDLARAQEVLVAGGSQPKLIQALGEPVTEVVAIAEKLGVDLVVVGSSGRGTLGRLVMGSVSDGVVRSWPGATLVVKPPA